MSCIRYNVVKNGKVTNSWTSDFAGADYYEPCFGQTAWTEVIETGVIEYAAEYTVVAVDVTAAEQQKQINAEALAYLADTDWMIIRNIDTGEAVPEEIKAAREQARNKIIR